MDLMMVRLFYRQYRNVMRTRTQRRFVGPLSGSYGTYYEGEGVGLLIQEGWRIQSECGIWQIP